jgi:hypothetical protein
MLPRAVTARRQPSVRVYDRSGELSRRGKPTLGGTKRARLPRIVTTTHLSRLCSVSELVVGWFLIGVGSASASGGGGQVEASLDGSW